MKKVLVNMSSLNTEPFMNHFISLMNNRFACKKFDTNKKLDKKEIDFILECARLSPSSFGLEHWHFFAVTSPHVISQLYEVCFQQEAVLTAPFIVISVFRKNDTYAPNSPFITERGSRFPGGLDIFVDDYKGYYAYLSEKGALNNWAKSQCYIPCANMMTGAIAAGIDSCAIEGFDNNGVISVLGLDSSIWETGIITVFGFSAEENIRTKIRMPREEIISYV
ncbi:MAG TPA: NAD(P)H-dependent oxidoreductase [Treponemataceae bacterium]|nr:NAD(P)H-dependent oxidoreductase [Treponemataceae bacterium]